jgi:co-chaperonin GroES (HSP10)
MKLKTEKTSSNSNQEVPKTRLALEEKYNDEKKEVLKKEEKEKRVDETNVASIQDELPEPAGFRLLVLPFTPKEKTKGGILVAQETLDRLRIAVNCGYVIKLGPLAYKDEDKFPTGAWCKKGDWVIFARYAGSRLPIEGGEVRLLNDDEVLGTIKDPESVLHHI